MHYVAATSDMVKVTRDIDCLPPDCGEVKTFAYADNALACAAAHCKEGFDRAGKHLQGLDADEYDAADVAAALAYVYKGGNSFSAADMDRVQELLAVRFNSIIKK